MTGKQLKAIRKRLGVTQVGLANLVGVRSNTIARWERNELPIREPMARLIHTFVRSKKR